MIWNSIYRGGGGGNSLISSLSVGDSVFCNVDGTRTEFLIVHKGNPDASLYDASCDGVWVLSKYAPNPNYIWYTDGYSNYYEHSTMNTSFNNDYFTKIEDVVKNMIVEAKIPYVGSDIMSSYVAHSGADGLSCHVFLLSTREVNGAPANSLSDGSRLDYFSSSNDRIMIAQSGAQVNWWMRSPDTSTSAAAFIVDSAGGFTSFNTMYSYQPPSGGATRPAFILPYTAKTDKDHNIIG